jgi:trans-AT polyketide synthase/acyltransferase/oxidoreductase domain-containing protein
MTTVSLWTGARGVERRRGSEQEVRDGAGMGLAAVLAQHGVDLALAGLEGWERIRAWDDEVEIELARDDDGVRMRTRWPDGASTEERVQAGAPRVDLAGTLRDSAVPLWRAGGAWFARAPDVPTDGFVPAVTPETLGSASFRAEWGVRHAWMAGAMAGGIASVDLVCAMHEAGFLASFGAGGLGLPAVEAALGAIRARIGGPVPVANLLHNPVEPDVEEATVDLYVRHGVRAVEASAYMGLTPALVRWRVGGLREVDGRVVPARRVIAKVSRVEVAEHMVRPPPEAMLAELVSRGAVTPEQASLARRVAVADAVTAEGDSGGHTDRRPLVVLLPVLQRLARRLSAETGTPCAHVGAAGGLGDPWSVAAALALGADYIVTGSVNQCTREAGTSPLVKQALAEAGYADVTMGPAPDMFEIGAEVQVLARGTLYAQRARRLHELYRAHASLEEIPIAEREKLERQVFQRTLGEVWTETRAYWAARDAREVERAERDPRHRMALVFRWYLGWTSRWAREGEASRRRDFQVWCGAAMGAFNDWARGSALAPAEARGVVAVNRALAHGACVAMRVRTAEALGETLPATAFDIPLSA